MSLKELIKYKAILILVLILLISSFLRFYRLSDVYVFNFDEEYQATYAWTLVQNFHPIWIGVSASFLDFYLGPYFTYFTYLVLSVTNGDIMLTAYIASLMGIVTTAVIFMVGLRFFNIKVAVIASILYATLPLFVFFDQKYWNAMFIVLITVLTFFVLNVINRSKWWWILYAGLLGIVFNTHLAPLPLFLIGLFYFIRGKYWKDIKLIILCVISFLLFYWPLIVFDLNHNFSNILAFTRLNSNLNQSKIVFDPGIKFQSLFDSMGRFWYLKPGSSNADEINFSCNPLTVKPEFKNIVGQYTQRTTAPFYLSLLSIMIVIYYLWITRDNKETPLKLLKIFLIVSIFSFIVYPGGSSEYYTLSILALLILVVGVLISRLRKLFQNVALFLLILISLQGINTVLSTSDEFSLGPKKRLISEVMKVVGDQPFSIEGRGICHNYEGWRYLFKVYGRTPNRSYTDEELGWLYQEEINYDPNRYTVIISEDRIPLEENFSDLLSIKEGGYRAYIRNNF